MNPPRCPSCDSEDVVMVSAGPSGWVVTCHSCSDDFHITDTELMGSLDQVGWDSAIGAWS